MNKFARLRALANESKSRTEEARKERVEKKEAKREEAQPEPPILEPEESKQKEKRKIDSTHVREWFVVGVRTMRNNSSWAIGRWTVKERKLAINLLDDYGADLVEKAVAHFCSTWHERIKRGAPLYGDPNVNLLWGMRNQIFPEVQAPSDRPKPAKNSDEYNEKSDKGSGIGW